jgi:hypothetical protein
MLVTCKFLGFNNNVAEIALLLGYDNHIPEWMVHDVFGQHRGLTFKDWNDQDTGNFDPNCIVSKCWESCSQWHGIVSETVHVSHQVTVRMWCCCFHAFCGWITLNMLMAGNACDKHFITFKHTSLLSYSSRHILKEFGMWIWCCISGEVFMHDITNLTLVSEAEPVMWQWIVLLNCVSQRTWTEALV